MQSRVTNSAGPSVAAVDRHHAQPEGRLADQLPLLCLLGQFQGALQVLTEDFHRGQLAGAHSVGQDDVAACGQRWLVGECGGHLQPDAGVVGRLVVLAQLAVALGQLVMDVNLPCGFSQCLPTGEGHLVKVHTIGVAGQMMGDMPHLLPHRRSLPGSECHCPPVEGQGLIMGIASVGSVASTDQPVEGLGRISSLLEVVGQCWRSDCLLYTSPSPRD